MRSGVSLARVAGFLLVSISAFGSTGATAQAMHVVVIGDSNIEGKGVASGDAYPAQLERALPARGFDVSVTNAGKNGDTSSGVLARLQSSVPDGTDLALVSVGVNDVVIHGQLVASVRANVAEIGRQLRARGIETIILPTGKAFQGAIKDDPAYHVEGQGRPEARGPAHGTEWYLTAAGYAQVANRTLGPVASALKRAAAKKKKG